MSKIHINSNGEPGVCKATTKPCPFGDDSTHFSSNEEAVQAYSKAQEVLGNASFGKTTVKPGEAFAYFETREAADKVANLITNEGKYAAIVKHTSKYAIGEPDIDDYEDEEEFKEALEEFRDSIEAETVEFEESVSGYQVRAFDSFEQAKSADPNLWNGDRDRTDIPVEIDSVDEVSRSTAIDDWNSKLYEVEVTFKEPKK